MRRMLLTGILAGLLTSAPAFADEGGLFYYSGGGNLLNPAPLNTLIQPQGYKAYDSWTWGQGLGVYGVVQRFLVGAEYQALWGQLSASGQESLKLEGGYGLFQLGYLAVASPTFQFYPYIGIGPGSITLRSSKPLNGLLSISQGSNNTMLTATANSLLLDLGLGANLIVPMSPGNTSDSRGPSVSLRAGYLFSITSSQWSSNELPVTGGPALNPGGFYARLMIGFGAYQ